MNQTVVVTGDSKGLGAETVETLLRTSSKRVVGLSRSETEATEQLTSEFPDRYTHVEFDLSNPGAIGELYRGRLKSLGPITGLVNNAAAAYDDIVTNVDPDRLARLFAVNVQSPIVLSKYVLRDMLLNGVKGSLVHISSVSTATGYSGLSMYAATKGALESFSLGIAREWGERGVRSNCVAPGFMETPMTETLSNQQRERIYDRTSLKQPTELDSAAETIVFLLSDAASSVTGEVVRVDSGTV